jgi:hypothetical protein
VNGLDNSCSSWLTVIVTPRPVETEPGALVPLDDGASRVVSLRSWSHFWSHSPAFDTVRGAPTATRHRRSGRRQPALNANQQTWKVCWRQRLTSSNLASSAAVTWQNVVGA